MIIIAVELDNSIIHEHAQAPCSHLYIMVYILGGISFADDELAKHPNNQYINELVRQTTVAVHVCHKQMHVRS